MTVDKLQTAAQITAQRAGVSKAADEISPQRYARIIDGTVSKRDIAEATAVLKSWQEEGLNNGPWCKATEREAEENADKLNNHTKLVAALVDQYRKQPAWQSMLENIKDVADKWGSQIKQEFSQGSKDPKHILQNIR